jgi:hypothetical protein
MIIADLNHIETIAQETTIAGGWNFWFPKAEAFAVADAQAVGFYTQTKSGTLTQAAAGVFSSSSSFSYSKAVG